MARGIKGSLVGFGIFAAAAGAAGCAGDFAEEIEVSEVRQQEIYSPEAVVQAESAAEESAPKAPVKKYGSLIDQAAAQGNLDGIMQHKYEAEAREKLGMLGFKLDNAQLMIWGVSQDIESLETRYLASNLIVYQNSDMKKLLSSALEKLGSNHEITQSLAWRLKAGLEYARKCENSEEHIRELEGRLSVAGYEGKYERIKTCADILGNIREKEDELDAAMEECNKTSKRLKDVMDKYTRRKNENGKQNN